MTLSMNAPTTKAIFQLAASQKIRRNAIKVAIVVGVILNVINQGPVFWNGEKISWIHVLLNFLVPFCVSSYSATKNQISHAESARPKTVGS